MGVALRATAAVVCTALLGAWGSSQATPDSKELPIYTYSQKTLLKNWALTICLARISPDDAAKTDASATASAYLEYGKQPPEAYDELRALVNKYVSMKYGGHETQAEFNTMKCIDLFHSKELDRVATKWASKR